MTLERYNPIVIGLIGLFTLFSINIGFDLVPDIQAPADAEQTNPFVTSDGTYHRYARVQGDSFQTIANDQWTDILVKGVNMGMAKPGHFPAEAAITYDEYLRWFDQIGEMNADAVRVYSIQPPQFYRALRDHNEMHPDSILFLFQGIYANEVMLSNAESAFDPVLTRNMRSIIENTMDAIHGSLRSMGTHEVPKGDYDTDVSCFVLGLILGQEWDPSLVMRTDTAHAGMEDLTGTYIMTSNGSPFEIWLGGMLEHMASYGSTMYSFQAPLSFVNYQALDKLDHPLEPVRINDLVSVDPDHILASYAFKTGLFATFHAYPYYPNFMNLEYVEDRIGSDEVEISSYAAYLRELRSHHTTPILVGEFGLPTSKGLAARNVDGMDQGALTEEEQGRFLADMFSSMVDEGLMGGIVFSWQDEWFKTTWNVRSAVDTDGKPDWYDPMNCEENYGLLSFGPGNVQRIVIDGSKEDWTALGSSPVSNEAGRTGPSLIMTSDEGYLYIMVDLGDHAGCDVRLLLDTLPGHGTVPIGSWSTGGAGFEFMVEIPNEGSVSLFVDSAYNVLNPVALGTENGFVPLEMVTTCEHIEPSTGDAALIGTFRAGDLVRGTSDSAHGQNQLYDICTSADGRSLELRLPWGMLNFRDPSKKVIVGNVQNDGPQASVIIDKISVQALVLADGQDSGDDASIIASNGAYHTWDTWDAPTYHERLKGSYQIMMEAFAAI